MDDAVHDGNLGHEIGGVVRTEYHETERTHPDAIVLLQHIAVEVLLQAVVIERGVWQIQASDIGLPSEGLDDGLAIGVDHLLAALPVIYGKGTVIVTANHIDGASDVHLQVEDGPLLAIGTDIVVANEAKELLSFTLHRDHLRLSMIGERTDGLEGAVLEPVLRLLVDERAYLAGHTADACPLVERFLHGDAIALPLAHGLLLGVEGFEEVGD